MNADLTCSDTVGGRCSLKNSCTTYTNLWNNGWSFKVMFTGSTNYAIVPLGALAADDDSGVCQIYIQYLNDNQHTMSGSVVFGSLMLQQYAIYQEYDYTAGTTAIHMYKSTSNTLTGSYVGAGTYTAGSDPFTLLHGTTQQIFINNDQFNYQTTIGASLGFQGQTQMKVSLLGNYVYAYEDDCLIKGGGTVWVSCEESPVYAINYFNKTVYYSEGNTQTYEGADYSGYVTDGNIFSAAVCMTADTTKYFCNTANSQFYSVNSVYSNNWNAY